MIQHQKSYRKEAQRVRYTISKVSVGCSVKTFPNYGHLSSRCYVYFGTPLKLRQHIQFAYSSDPMIPHIAYTLGPRAPDFEELRPLHI